MSDLIIEYDPALAPEQQSHARHEVQARRTADRESRKRMWRQKFSRARRARRNARILRHMKGAGRVARAVGMRAASAAGLRGVAATGPVGIVAVVVMAVGAIAYKIYRDVPFEKLGNEFERFLLGDAADEARANIAAKMALSGTPHWSQALASGNKIEVGKQFDLVKTLALRDIRGKAMIETTFGVNGPLDWIINGLWNSWMRAWNSSGAEESVTKTKQRLYENSVPNAMGFDYGGTPGGW